MTAPKGDEPLETLVRERRIIVCCGSGGVGKTTTAAVIALQAAEAGRKAVVVTIDPAKRLADALGLDGLTNEPSRIDGDFAGELSAMMLDTKSTFDALVGDHASDDEQRERILNNSFYRNISGALSGTQEYMAMEKLGQLHAAASEDPDVPDWDLIVVDTPPSRSALDFLDAPERLSSLLDGRFIKLLLAPAKGPARLLSAGFGIVTSALNKVLGAQVLSDVQTFVAAFDTLFGGFRQRAEATYSLLQADGTAFLVVAAPEADAMREAAYFVERLAAEDMPLAGLVVNRVHERAAGGLTAADAESGATRLRAADEESVAELLDVHADRERVAAREEKVQRRFTGSHPTVPTVPVAALPTDVHDLDGLRRIGDLIAGR